MSTIKKYIVLGVVVILIGASFWYAPPIISFVQNLSNPSSANPSNSYYNAPYTNVTLRDGINYATTLDFGDTEYSFDYYAGLGGHLHVSTFIGGVVDHTPHNGDVYRDFGIETDVSKIASDYISDYIVISVRPTVQNYMASLNYTRVNIPLSGYAAVNISSISTNETHQYGFSYSSMGYVVAVNLKIEVEQLKTDVTVTVGIPIKVWNIEIYLFKLESQYIVFYVKPLY